jgi:hypothetical protein
MCFRFYKKRTQDSEKCCSLSEDFEDTKGVIKIVYRRTDNTMAKRTRTNNDLPNITQKTKDRVTRTTLEGPSWS